ncbi:MAG: hypothetical protein SNJ67_14765 [Chloracidobacterium sp.]
MPSSRTIRVGLAAALFAIGMLLPASQPPSVYGQAQVGRVIKVRPRVSIQSFRFDPPEITATEYGTLARLRVIVRLDLNDGDRFTYEVPLVAIPWQQRGFADIRVKDIGKSITLSATQPIQEVEFEFRAFRNELQTTDVEVGAEVEIITPNDHPSASSLVIRGRNPRRSRPEQPGERLVVRRP